MQAFRIRSAASHAIPKSHSLPASSQYSMASLRQEGCRTHIVLADYGHQKPPEILHKFARFLFANSQYSDNRSTKRTRSLDRPADTSTQTPTIENWSPITSTKQKQLCGCTHTTKFSEIATKSGKSMPSRKVAGAEFGAESTQGSSTPRREERLQV